MARVNPCPSFQRCFSGESGKTELWHDRIPEYSALGFSALLPLINPPGRALELLGIVGVFETKPYKILARKVAVNTTLS